MPSVYDRFNLVSDFALAGDQPRAIGELTEGLERGDRAPGAARRHRLGQDVHDGADHRPREPADAGDGPQQDAGGAALPGVQALLSRTTRSSTSSATTTTTSPKPTSRPPTRTSRRKRRSTTRSTACGCRRRGRCSSAATSSSSPACRASTASARRRRTTACCCRSSAASGSAATQILRKLVEIQYERNDVDFGRGTFRVRGDIVEIYPSYEEQGLRIELFGDEVDELASFDPLTGKTLRRHDKIAVYPKSHFVAPREQTRRAVEPDQGGARLVALEARRRRQAARGAAAASADDVRSGDDAGDRLLPRHRELRAAPDRTRAGRAAADAARLPAERCADHRRREPSDRAADSRHVSRATGRARKCSSPTASGCRRRSTTGR